MKRPGRLALLVLACAWGAPGSAESGPHDGEISQLGLERWSPQDGLAGSLVLGIVEGRDGFLWIATSGGLSRFDGHRFRNFTATAEPDSPTSGITAVVVGPDGRIWVGLARGGVRVLEEGALRPSPWGAGLPRAAVRSLVADPTGVLWVGTAEGLWRAAPAGAEQVPLSPEASPAIVRDLALGSDGALWVRTLQHGLWRVERGAARSIPDAPGCVGHAITFGRDGHPITACEDGIWERPTGAGWLLLSHVRIAEHLLVDRQGALWFGDVDGLVRRTADGRAELLRVANGLGDRRVRSFLEDSRGDVWVGTYSAGLSHLRHGTVLAVEAGEGLPIRGTTGVAADADGDLWVGTNDLGLFRWRSDRGIVGRWTAAAGLPSDRVWAIAFDRERAGRVWLGTSQGIAILENGSPRPVQRPDGRTSDEVTIVWADPASPTIWAGGPAGGADELRGGRVTRHGEENGLRAGRIRVFHRERSGALLAAGDRGVFRYDGSTWREVSFAGTKPVSVRALAEQPDGTLWIASGATGLHRWSGGKLRRLGEREGLPFNTIHALELDRSGGLWLSSDEGPLRLRLDDVDRWARAELQTVPTLRLSARDGLRTHECNGWGRPASGMRADGTLVFPTINGVALVDPSHLPRAELIPAEVFLDRVRTGLRSLPPGGPFRLGPDERDLLLRFGALEFDHPDAVRFRYRLEGLDDRWLAAGSQQEAAYSYVPPGRYRFRLQARLPGQEWVEATVSPEVRIVPRLWEATWFRALAAGLLLLAAYGSVRWRLGVQKAHADVLRRSEAQIAASREELRRLASELLRAQEEERARVAREIHDDLTQRLAGLAMLAGGFAQAARKGNAQGLPANLEELGRQLERLAADSQALSRDLHPSLLENVGLEGALRSECATFGERTGMRVAFESRGVPADLPPEVGIVLYRIAQEALRNSHSHSGSKEAEVTLARVGEAIELSIEDEGSGFDTAGLSGGRGLGLTSMGERARLIGAGLTIESNPGAGTRVRVRVPWPAGHDSKPAV